MKITSIVLGALVAAAGGWTFSGSAAQLGDPAKALVIQEWVQGQAVDVLDGKNTYVVEFWATWCGPCRRSIPHLTELQKKYKDKGIVVVGISDEPPAKVKPWVEKMGEQMHYTVACDDQRQSNARYMQAYGQGGIPTAFVVSRQGKVVWVGHPMAGLDKALDEIVAGTYDIAAATKADAARAAEQGKRVAADSAMREYQQLASEGSAKARDVGRKLLAEAGDHVPALVSFAFSVVGNTANTHRDFALAEEALAKAEKLAGAKDHRIIGTRAIALFESGKQAEGLALAKEALALSTAEQDQAKYRHFIRIMETRMKQ